MIKIIFDLDDTLYEIFSIFEKSIKINFPTFPRTSIYDLYKEFRNQSNLLFPASQDGSISVTKMRKMRIKEALSIFSYNIDDSQAKSFQNTYENNQYNINLSEEVKSILDYCKNHKIVTGIITNGPYDHQLKKIESLEVVEYIDDKNIIISGSLGIDKPDIRIFKEMEQRIGYAGKYVYVGDSFETDIEGAIEAGWKAIWFNAKQDEPTNEALNYKEVQTYKELLKEIKSLNNINIS